jgi:hypothetical protein
VRSIFILSLSIPLLGACQSDSAILGLDEEDTGGIEEEEPIDPYEGATLEILSPAANSFLAYGEEADFEAVVWSKDGDPLIFDEINWNSTLDEDWRHQGNEFVDDGLDVGIHLLRVNAELPNGERLFNAVGGILVQAEHAGTYAGSVIVAADLGEFQVGCAGGAIMVVDVYGEEAVGEADCILSMQGQVIELDYVFDLEVDGQDLEGEAALSVYGFEMPTDFKGEVSDDSEIGGTWEQSVFGYMELSGVLRIERVSRDTSHFE